MLPSLSHHLYLQGYKYTSQRDKNTQIDFILIFLVVVSMKEQNRNFYLVLAILHLNPDSRGIPPPANLLYSISECLLSCWFLCRRRPFPYP